ncbi:MAG TPA: glycosyltransferase family 4 protein, partial [Steroidobacteraceae bacterium]|nr:glycosyltransferase family 4 protein [Steroidobacteraceae bacterium]
MIRVLLIGPLPPPMGGDTRHFAQLAADLAAHVGFAVRVVNTSRGAAHSDPWHNLVAGVRTIAALIRNLHRSDVVSFHASDRGMVLVGPWIVGLSKLVGRPVILRMFGGSFGDFWSARGAFVRAWLRRTVFAADVVLLQTRRMIGQLRGQGASELVWFSTYIRRIPPPADLPARKSPHCRRLVFLGHLWRTKGVETLLEAAPHLPDGVTVDLFGPLDEYTPEMLRERGAGRVTYRGFLSHDEVEKTLWNYDCLVLPTFHPGEGYPGVIAEAFAHGLPVISTRWLAIPEIVDESCGILIEPGD